MPEIKHPNRPIGPHRCEHVSSPSGLGKGHVINLFVVGDQLRLHMTRHRVHSTENLNIIYISLKFSISSVYCTPVYNDTDVFSYLSRFQTPNSAGGVNGRGAQQIGVDLIPVKRG